MDEEFPYGHYGILKNSFCASRTVWGASMMVKFLVSLFHYAFVYESEAGYVIRTQLLIHKFVFEASIKAGLLQCSLQYWYAYQYHFFVRSSLNLPKTSCLCRVIYMKQ